MKQRGKQNRLKRSKQLLSDNKLKTMLDKINPEQHSNFINQWQQIAQANQSQIALQLLHDLYSNMIQYYSTILPASTQYQQHKQYHSHAQNKQDSSHKQYKQYKQDEMSKQQQTQQRSQYKDDIDEWIQNINKQSNQFNNIKSINSQIIISNNNTQLIQTLSPSNNKSINNHSTCNHQSNNTNTLYHNLNPNIQNQNLLQYINQILSYLQSQPQFAPSFSISLYNSFIPFLNQFQKLQIIPKLQLKSLSKKLTRQYTNQSQSTKFSKENYNQNLIQHLQIVNSALYHTTQSYQLRPTQILSIYSFLNHPNLTRIVLQILTGQGKSTTLSCLAAILYMRRQTVDIITTSNILAIRDANQKQNFFNCLGIPVGHNCWDDKIGASSKPKSCYQDRAIVYGTPHTNQVDILFDEYQKKGTRSNRIFQTAIIDEVDSMFIDSKSHQTLLSTTFSGFSELNLPMYKIWEIVVLYDITVENDKISIQIKNDNQTIKGDLLEAIKIINRQIRKQFENQIIQQCRQQFVDFSLDQWITSAIYAARVYKQNKHYVIEDQKIIPVDYDNTGCHLKNVQWQNGLHQFLQIKHSLPITVESMTSNYMSNIGHFLRYKNIYGLTGTLGSVEGKQFLKETYHVQMLNIPPFKKRQLTNLPGQFTYSRIEWIKRIVHETNDILRKQRSILIICHTIQDVQIIKKGIQTANIQYNDMKILIDGLQEYNDQVDCQEIIIATNIAGRGTDLKNTSKLVQNGGLHVLVAFLPRNQRVEEQARGRAGRNGQPGSSTIIADFKQSTQNKINIDRISYQQQNYQHKVELISRFLRDSDQKIQLKKDRKKVKQLQVKDRMFTQFCESVNKIQGYQKSKAMKKAIQQQWAMFLKKSEHQMNLIEDLSIEDIEQQGKQLIKSFKQNPKSHFHTSHNLQLGLQSMNKSNFIEAKQRFKDLQQKDSTFMNKISGKMLESAMNIQLSKIVLSKDKKSQKIKQKLIKQGKNANILIQQSNKLLKQIPQYIEKRRNICKAAHSLIVSVGSKSIMNVLDQQNQIQMKQVHQQINQIFCSNLQNINVSTMKLPKNVQMKKQDKKIIQDLNHIPQIKLLDVIQAHVKQQSAILQTLKPQQIDINYKGLDNLIDQLLNKQQFKKQAVNKVKIDLPYLPVIKAKKPQSSWWNRVFVFAIGVAQITIGALIVKYASGIGCAGFGISMIHSGLKDCWKALFSPDVVQDLMKFYTQKALEYTVLLSSLGFKQIKQLAILGKNGFKVINNSSSAPQILNIVKKDVFQGLKKGKIDFNTIKQISKQGEKHTYKGVSRLFGSKKKLLEDDIKQTFKIMRQPQYMQLISRGCQKQVQFDIKSKQIMNKFEQESKQIINRLVHKLYPKFVNEIEQYQFNADHIRIVVKHVLRQQFNKQFEGQNKRKKQCLLLSMTSELLAKNNNLAQVVINKFEINKLIQSCFKQMVNMQAWKQIVQYGIKQLTQEVQKSINNVKNKQRSKCDQLTKQINQIHQQIGTQYLNLTQKQKQNKQQLLKQKALQIQQIWKQLIQFNENIVSIRGELSIDEQFVKRLMQFGFFGKGKIARDIQTFDIHRLALQALRQVRQYNTGQVYLQQQMKSQVYQVYSGIVINSLRYIMDQTSDSNSRLKNFQISLLGKLQINR